MKLPWRNKPAQLTARYAAGIGVYLGPAAVASDGTLVAADGPNKGCRVVWHEAARLFLYVMNPGETA